MRKIVGGKKSQLFLQFLGESIIITLIAVFITLALFEIALPHLNNFLQKNLSFNLLENYTFTLLIIACLGLFGLASFTTQQRKREVAIRKVMGSSVRSIVFLLAREFTKWVIVANIIAWPLAWFAMRNWLQNFAYQTNMNLLIFVGSGLAALVIAFITISFRTIRAASSNPVKALKYE